MLRSEHGTYKKPRNIKMGESLGEGGMQATTDTARSSARARALQRPCQ